MYIKDYARGFTLLKLRHKALRGLSATAELLVYYGGTRLTTLPSRNVNRLVIIFLQLPCVLVHI